MTEVVTVSAIRPPVQMKKLAPDWNRMLATASWAVLTAPLDWHAALTTQLALIAHRLLALARASRSLRSNAPSGPNRGATKRAPITPTASRVRRGARSAPAGELTWSSN